MEYWRTTLWRRAASGGAVLADEAHDFVEVLGDDDAVDDELLVGGQGVDVEPGKRQVDGAGADGSGGGGIGNDFADDGGGVVGIGAAAGADAAGFLFGISGDGEEAGGMAVGVFLGDEGADAAGADVEDDDGVERHGACLVV